MSDERQDDEILGRALARAIETIDVNETPFERSRIAEAPARRPLVALWQVGAAAAAIVLALAIGSWFLRPTEGQPAVAASPTPPAATAINPTPSPVATPILNALDHRRVYFPRDGLPPVSVQVGGLPIAGTAEARIKSRVDALNNGSSLGSQIRVPTGAFNPFPLQDPGLLHVLSVRVQGDLATVDMTMQPGGWGVTGSTRTIGLVQELVYTASEEPGIRRVLFTQNGGKQTTIDQFIWDKPLAREDVFGYGSAGSRDTAQAYGSTTGPTRILTTRTSVDQVAPGLARVVIETDQQQVLPADIYPDFNVRVVQNDETTDPLGGKWRLVVSVFHSEDRTTGSKVIDATPLRSISAAPGPNGTVVYQIGLDDLRPWRTALAINPVRFVIDIGGTPGFIVGPNAVYAPRAGATVDRTFIVSGIAHNYEANVVIRVRDAQGVEVYKGFTTATTCCDPGGTFDASVTLPASVSGKVTLEVLEASARDGSDTKLITIPLTVR